MKLRLHYPEHILRGAALVIGKGFLPGHALRLRFQNQPKGFPVFPVKEGKRLLAPHMEQQIAFADAAPQNHLDGVYAAGIVFADTYNFFIRRQASRVSAAAQPQLQKLDGI